MKTRRVSIQSDHEASLMKRGGGGVVSESASGSAVGGLRTVFIHKWQLRLHEPRSWETGTEVSAESQTSQKAKPLCERMSYKTASAQQLGEITWKLLCWKKLPPPLLHPEIRIFWLKAALMPWLCCQELEDIYIKSSNHHNNLMWSVF